MPINNSDKQRYPPVDILKAVILERKMVMKLNYNDMAAAAGVYPSTLRHMMTEDHTDDWPPLMRAKLCKRLGIDIETTIKLQNADGGIKLDGHI